MSRRHPSPRALPSGLAVVIVLILAGVAAAASHTSLWAVPRDGVGYVSELLTTVALAFAATFAVSAALLLGSRRSRDHAWRSALAPTVVIAVLVSLLGISRTDLHLEAPVPGVERVDTESGRLGTRLRMDWRGPAVRIGDEAPVIEGTIPASAARARLVRVLLLLVGGLTLMLVMRAWGMGRRARPLSVWDPSDGRTRVAAHTAIVHSIDAMLAAPDDRTAIIGAYARLLEELETIGASRRSYEGPTEHLRRVLGMLAVGPAPLRTLVRLFEVARFSEHSLTGAHRQQALAALREVADSLAAPAGARRAVGVAE